MFTYLLFKNGYHMALKGLKGWPVRAKRDPRP